MFIVRAQCLLLFLTLVFMHCEVFAMDLGDKKTSGEISMWQALPPGVAQMQHLFLTARESGNSAQVSKQYLAEAKKTGLYDSTSALNRIEADRDYSHL